MNSSKMTREEFAEAVHCSVHGVVGLYEQVKLLMSELHDLMMSGEKKFVPLIPGQRRIRAHHYDYKREGTGAAVKLLRPWYGNLFVPMQAEAEPNDEDEETDDDEVEPKGRVELINGARLLFAKAVIYSTSRSEPVEPMLLIGAVKPGLGAGGNTWPEGHSFLMKKTHTRYLLEAIHRNTEVGRHRTKGKATKAPGAKKEKLDLRVYVTLTENPELMPLHEFKGPEAVTNAADRFKGLW